MSAKQRRRRENRRRNHSETSSTPRRLVLAGGLTAGATLAMVGSAQAAPLTYTVGTNADASTGGACTAPANGTCSLREAVGLANANPGADTILFNSNLTGSTINLATGELQISEAVSIDGGAFGVTVDGGGGTQRIFNVDPTAGDPVAISNLTLTDGDAGTGSGGAVYNNDADLTISNAVISDSYATDIANTGRGGGVYTNSGPLTIDSSTLTGNHAYYGGGIGSLTGEVMVTDSTVSGNYADGDTGNATNPGADGYGGGINIFGADLTVTGSTIDHNVGAYDGGGIYSGQGSPGGAVTVINSTIADNQALNDDGGAVWIAGSDTNDALTVIDSTVTGNTAATKTGGLESFLGNVDPVLRNSIVSGNTSGTHPSSDDLYAYSGHGWDASFDLIGVPSTYVNTTVPSSNLFGVNPQLGTLQDNGGLTDTMKPSATSPVIDCGSDTTHAFDQRGAGFPRVVNQPNRTNSTASGANGADMGSVEVAANPLITGACTNSPPPTPAPGPNPAPGPTTHKKKCKKHKKHKRSAQSAKKKKCKKKKKK
jgi:hypothetical protein